MNHVSMSQSQRITRILLSRQPSLNPIRTASTNHGSQRHRQTRSLKLNRLTRHLRHITSINHKNLTKLTTIIMTTILHRRHSRVTPIQPNPQPRVAQLQVPIITMITRILMRHQHRLTRFRHRPKIRKIVKHSTIHSHINAQRRSITKRFISRKKLS